MKECPRQGHLDSVTAREGKTDGVAGDLALYQGITVVSISLGARCLLIDAAHT